MCISKAIRKARMGCAKRLVLSGVFKPRIFSLGAKCRRFGRCETPQFVFGAKRLSLCSARSAGVFARAAFWFSAKRRRSSRRQAPAFGSARSAGVRFDAKRRRSAPREAPAFGSARSDGVRFDAERRCSARAGVRHGEKRRC
jgi:hypothetical protein